jgi:hypothetical protein
MDHAALESAGIDRHLPAAEKAAALVRRLVLRWDAVTGPRELATVVEARWFAGVAESLKILAGLCRGTTGRGVSFGAPWPYLDVGGRLLAPALPVVASGEEVAGPDGVYTREDDTVWREAVGERRPHMRLDGSLAPPGQPFELLWFGGADRCILREGVLEVEDLFACMRLPASRELIERLVVRGLRAEAGVLEGLAFGGWDAPAEIEVRQRLDLLLSTGWRDPTLVLASREDIRSAERRGDEIRSRTVHDQDVIFKLVEEPNGWRAFTWEGRFPLQALAMFEREESLCYSATLGPGLDPLAPGVRGAVVFDLRADLVALQKS